jgi:hypothetical protein
LAVLTEERGLSPASGIGNHFKKENFDIQVIRPIHPAPTFGLISSQ